MQYKMPAFRLRGSFLGILVGLMLTPITLSAAAFSPPLAPGGCEPEWVPTFGAAPGINGTAKAFAVFDDGTGPALYVGGGFSAASGVSAHNIVHWNGQAWSSVGEGFNNRVTDLIVFDDGAGSALYASGTFTHSGAAAVNYIARWNGESWSSLDLEQSGGGGVLDLEVYDDGSGPSLYACGYFRTPGSTEPTFIARWDGKEWHEVGGGVQAWPEVMIVHDDGSGPMLYVGGNLYQAGETEAYSIARWDGQQWHAVGEGFVGSVSALAVYDVGNGPELFAGGRFTAFDQMSLYNVARWDGSIWHEVGKGIRGNGLAEVDEMGVHDFGSGPELWISGSFDRAGDTLVDGYAQWNGETWSGDPFSGLSGVSDFAIFDHGAGPIAFVAGLLREDNRTIASGVLQFIDDAWIDVGGDPNALRNVIPYVVEFNTPDGVELIVGGSMPRNDGAGTTRLARWTGSDWDPLLSETDGLIRSLHVIEEDSKPMLVVGGSFTQIDGLTVNHIARWNGAVWSPFGAGFDDDVRDTVIFDAGNGPELYAAGDFDETGNAEVNAVARWNGSAWQRLGSGIDGWISDLIVFNDGSGDALYAAGDFDKAGGNTNARGVARWDGENWSNLSTGTTRRVYALAVFDDGSGPALYAGGEFTEIGGVAANHIAKWNGQLWEPVGAGLIATVRSLEVFDDGTGPALYAGLSGTSPGTEDEYFVRRWDGQEWIGVGSPSRGGVATMYATTMNSISTLYLGGQFHYSPAGDSYLAVYQGCGPTTSPAPLVDFNIAFGSLISGGLSELIDSDDARLHARSGIGFSALEPNVLELRVGAISPDVGAGSIDATIEARISNPNGAVSVRLRNWSTNQFDIVYVYTIGVSELIEAIDGIDATNHIRASDGRIELAHKIVVVASFSAIGFDGFFDQVELRVVE